MSSVDPISDPGGNSVADLLSQLQISSEAKAKRGRAHRNDFPVWGRPDIKITRWKFNEWDYGNSKVKLPVEARGLFTYDDKIVIRGYNKFFNIDEVPQTKWQWIEERTTGPYAVSLKENGCIVFMSGLKDGALIVTSKNSTGPREDAPNERNHSYVASQWVDRHLTKVGKTREQLAAELYRLNVTAVGELCDDEFEEHVLPYTEEDAGIYLHGLNLNTPKFATHPFDQVDKFAEEFGFYKTKYLIKDSLPELKSFLEACAATGSWEGKDVEGFVIRSRAKFDDSTTGDYFFKYKFKEPYLMYRDWREVTRAYLSGKARNDIRILRHKAVTNQYLDFVVPVLDSNKKLAKLFQENHGIIKVRQMFLDHVGKTGIELVNEDEGGADNEEGEGGKPVTAETKFVICPVSVIGCGKTTVFAALSSLFSWGHIQNDELAVGSKQKKTALVNGASEMLNENRVVLVDRNNHQFFERQQIIDDMKQRRRNLKFICINFWPEEVSKDQIRRVTRERIESRGDNHTTIKRSECSESKLNQIMGGFMNRFQPLTTTKNPDQSFELIVDLDITKGTRYNIEHTVKVLHGKYPEIVPNVPTSEQIDQAFEHALNYRPKSIKPSTTPSQSSSFSNNQLQEPPRKKAKTVYFNLEVSFPEGLTAVELIDKFYASNSEVDSSFWQSLKKNCQLQTTFHVTLAHVNGGTAGEKDLYNTLQEKYESTITQQVNKKKKTNVKLNHHCNISILNIAHNDRIMALHVDVEDEGLKLSKDKKYHITIGMISGVKPVESNDMLVDPKSTILKWNVEPTIMKDQTLCAFV